jgi:hypothetical protein
VSWLVQASGTVTYTPGANDLQAMRSPYSARFKVVDGGGGVVYFPSREDDVWKVRK